MRVVDSIEDIKMYAAPGASLRNVFNVIQAATRILDIRIIMVFNDVEIVISQDDGYKSIYDIYMNHLNKTKKLDNKLKNLIKI